MQYSYPVKLLICFSIALCLSSSGKAFAELHLSDVSINISCPPWLDHGNGSCYCKSFKRDRFLVIWMWKFNVEIVLHGTIPLIPLLSPTAHTFHETYQKYVIICAIPSQQVYQFLTSLHMCAHSLIGWAHTVVSVFLGMDQLPF